MPRYRDVYDWIWAQDRYVCVDEIATQFGLTIEQVYTDLHCMRKRGLPYDCRTYQVGRVWRKDIRVKHHAPKQKYRAQVLQALADQHAHWCELLRSPKPFRTASPRDAD
ncbi:hypothetical protein [Aeromonas salmonicida]|uniref:hypothetical protein n=1 Tax=Aeromonas salmonicida TaxID=645 RepID=UPI003D0360DC